MKKLLLLVVGILFLSPSFASAASNTIIDPANCPPDSSVCKDINGVNGTDNSDLFGSDGIVTRITSLLSVAAGVISIFIMIYAGLSYITSGGDSKKTATAKATIIYGAIGLVIAMIAGAIVSFVLVKI